MPIDRDEFKNELKTLEDSVLAKSYPFFKGLVAVLIPELLDELDVKDAEIERLKKTQTIEHDDTVWCDTCDRCDIEPECLSCKCEAFQPTGYVKEIRD
jgi:hypothetical protein